MKFTQIFLLLPLLALAAGQSEDFGARCADRAALERVYYNHRLGEKPPFEQVLPPAMLENLVRQDLRKETALKQAYGVEVTPALLDAEVQRINTTTRAPDILAEIKTALGHDPVRFADVFAKPILVERLLREMGAGRFVRALNWLWCLGILYSTVATRQHVSLDVLAGIALGAAVAVVHLRLLRAFPDAHNAGAQRT